jgi:signal transduction histidine kinase
VLLAEDSEEDAFLVLAELRSRGYALEYVRVCTEHDFAAELWRRDWSLIIADYSIPGFGAMEALALLEEAGRDIPFIIVSGTIGEDLAVKAMKAGAHDCIQKDKLGRLGPAIDRELREARVRREREQAEEDLRNSREELRALAAHLQGVREEERKNIAREIHDQLGQSLTGFKMDLAWMRHRLSPTAGEINRQPLLEKLAELATAMDASADLVRKLCTELRPGILDDLGLLPAVEWQAREFTRRAGIPCLVRFEVEELDMGPERSTALFRIFQEILTNVSRHAHARKVDVLMSKESRNVVLRVRDDGRGLDDSELEGSQSLGILGMRERALVFKGEVAIQGRRGKGTTVTVKIPLAESCHGTGTKASETKAGTSKKESQ